MATPTLLNADDPSGFPTFKKLPKVEGAPDGSAWLWGKDDELGRLNLVTSARVAAAAKLISTGDIIPLNLPLNEPEPTLFHREAFVHTIKKLSDTGFDDLYTLNTQSGSQWDGFRHFADRTTNQFYNNLYASEIDPNAHSHPTTTRCGTHVWHDHGIAGRAVFFDYAAYAEKKGLKVNSTTQHAITLKDLFEVAKQAGFDARPAAQGGDIKPGDILLIRSGFTKYWRGLPEEERVTIAGRNTSTDASFIGVEQTQEMVEWLHDCYFAAVAGDQPAFEVWQKKTEWFIHEFLLARFALPS